MQLFAAGNDDDDDNNFVDEVEADVDADSKVEAVATTSATSSLLLCCRRRFSCHSWY